MARRTQKQESGFAKRIQNLPCELRLNILEESLRANPPTILSSGAISHPLLAITTEPLYSDIRSKILFHTVPLLIGPNTIFPDVPQRLLATHDRICGRQNRRPMRFQRCIRADDFLCRDELCTSPCPDFETRRSHAITAWTRWVKTWKIPPTHLTTRRLDSVWERTLPTADECASLATYCDHAWLVYSLLCLAQTPFDVLPAHWTAGFEWIISPLGPVGYHAWMAYTFFGNVGGLVTHFWPRAREFGARWDVTTWYLIWNAKVLVRWSGWRSWGRRGLGSWGSFAAGFGLAQACWWSGTVRAGMVLLGQLVLCMAVWVVVGTWRIGRVECEDEEGGDLAVL